MDTSTTDIPSAILDEIALEGLDGITLNALWIRLSSRKNFWLPIDNQSKNFIWETIKEEPAVEAFLLAEPRPQLEIYNRYDYENEEIGQIVEPEMFAPDIYPVAPLEDKETGNRGSCTTYSSRIKLDDEEFRKISFSDAIEKWSERLVLVASQFVRNAALGGAMHEKVTALPLLAYVVLELVGRSRVLGESTQGRYGLLRLNMSAKNLFYFRKILLKDQLILKQPLAMRVSNRNVSGSIIHLTRFFELKQTRSYIITKRVVEALKEAPPHHAMQLHVLRAKLNLNFPLKKIFRIPEIHSFINTDAQIPFKDLNPDAVEKEQKSGSANEGNRLVRVVQLRDPNVDVDEVLRTVDDGPENVTQDESGEDDNNDSPGLLTQTTQKHHEGLLKQAYDYIASCGPKGSTQNALADYLGLTRLEARGLLRALTKLGMIEFIIADSAKQRIFVYIAAPFVSSNEIRSVFKKEKEKIIQFLSDKTETEEAGLLDQSTVSEENPDSSFSIEGNISQKEESMDETNLFRKHDSRRIVSQDMSYISSEVTVRSLKRANLILETVRKIKVIDEIVILLKVIAAEEAKEGYHARIDRRSLKRLLLRLANEGQIKNMRIVLRSRERERVLQFICHPSVTMEHSVIKSAIEQAKLKLFCVSKEQLAKLRAEQKVKEISPPHLDGLRGDLNPDAESSLKKSVQEIKQLQTKQRTSLKMEYNPTIGRVYGSQPKCVRIREVHRFLFYLVYGFGGDVDLDQTQAKQALEQNVTDLILEPGEQIPRIYCTSGDWRMFVPPLGVHAGWPFGWAFYCDVLLRFPLSLFVKVVNVTYHVEGLKEFLQHPVKQHLLLTQLPQDLREQLMYERKYIFSIHEVLTNLVYFGLLQFGPHNIKEKDQAFMYLNRKASILDTTTSTPGYHQVSQDQSYERRVYTFDSMEDVDNYWLDVWNICHHTPLGISSSLAGQTVTLEAVKKKPELMQALRPRQPDEAAALDDGTVPGDHLGASGFDSSLFAHLKRNWTFNISTVLSTRAGLQPKSVTRAPPPGRLASLHDKAIRFATHFTSSGETMQVPVTRETAEEISENAKKAVKRKRANQNAEPSIGWSNLAPKKRRVSAAPAKQTRVLKARQMKKRRRPYYDEADRAALRSIRRLRASWTPAEDSFLLNCKIAAVYLGGNAKNAISFYAMRDQLHAALPESRDKTSKSIQRRIYVMMRDPKTLYHVQTTVEELKQDPDIIAASGGGNLTKSEKAQLGVEKSEAVLVERFTKLLPYLLNRHSSVAAGGTAPNIFLPDTLDEFRRLYNTIIPQASQRSIPHEAHNTVDIHSSVVSSVVHSSLCTVEDKTSWAYQLFGVYQQYPDSLLRSVVAKMKANMMIAGKKKLVGKNRCVGQLPLSSCPYRLSITYANLFMTRYPHEIYWKSFTFLSKLAENKEAVDFTGTNEGGLAAVSVTLVAQNAVELTAVVPDQILVFDPRVESQPEQFSKLIERYNNLMSDAQASQAPVEEFLNQQHAAASEGTSNKGAVRVQQQLLARTASRIALHMMRDELTQEKATGGIHVQHLHDFFVLNACKLSVKLKDNWAPLDEQLKEGLIQSVQKTVGKCEENLLQAYNQKGFSEATKSDAEKVFQVISNRKEQGIFVSQLPGAVGRLQSSELSLIQHIQMLLASGAVLRVGVVSARYVASPFSAPWTVKSFKLLRAAKEKLKPLEGKVYTTEAEPEPGTSEAPTIKRRRVQSMKEAPTTAGILTTSDKEDITVFVKPWIRVDGSLNRRVLDRLLGAVLGHVMQKPGCSLQDLGVRFYPALQPFHTRELAEFLEKLGCVELFSLRKSVKASLFSPVNDIELGKQNLTFESEGNIYCKPLVDAILTLGQFIGNKKYENDYISANPSSAVKK